MNAFKSAAPMRRYGFEDVSKSRTINPA